MLCCCVLLCDCIVCCVVCAVLCVVVIVCCCDCAVVCCCVLVTCAILHTPHHFLQISLCIFILSTLSAAAWSEPTEQDEEPWAQITRYFEWKAFPPETLLQSSYTTQAYNLLMARENIILNLDTVEKWKQRQDEVCPVCSVQCAVCCMCSVLSVVR